MVYIPYKQRFQYYLCSEKQIISNIWQQKYVKCYLCILAKILCPIRDIIDVADLFQVQCNQSSTTAITFDGNGIITKLVYTVAAIKNGTLTKDENQ